MSNELEQKLTELQSKYDQAQSALEETRKQLETTERRQEIDRALMEADTIDLEAARLLTQVAIGVMDEADVKAAVGELRKNKPYLFRRTAVAGGGVMAARPRSNPGAALTDAAHCAAASGDRRDLLRYLRLRRKQN